MAVLVEGISVIVRRDAVESKYRGGWKGLIADVPNSTLCMDEELIRAQLSTEPPQTAAPAKAHRRL